MVKQGSKKIFLCGWMAAVLFFASCGKVQIEPNIPLQQVLTEYPVENVCAFSAAEDGTAYFVNLTIQNDITRSGYRLYWYNADGEYLGEHSLDNYSMIQTLAAGQDNKKIYFTGQGNSNDVCLFEVDLESGEINKLYTFPYFREIKRMVYTGGRLYVLGLATWNISRDLSSPDYDFSAGERIVYFDLETKEAYQFGLDYPINMAPGEEGRLAVVGYLPSEGYCLMEYDPVKDEIQVKERLERFLFDAFAVCNQGKSLLYSYASNQFGLLMVDIGNLDLEVEVYEGAMMGDTMVTYSGGRVYCQNMASGHMIGFPLSAVRRDNRTIRLITSSYSNAPYGCGYALDRIDLSWDQIVLKTLAQDEDYDLCIAGSQSSGSQVMKNSNSFYPLNDIPGIEEYLDRCFPYVREAATKEDGTIWMLPFLVFVDGMLVQEEKFLQDNIIFSDGVTCEKLALALHKASKEKRDLFSFSISRLASTLINQYLWHNGSVTDRSFLGYMENFKQIYQDLPQKTVTVITEELLCHTINFGMSDRWGSEESEMQWCENAGYTFYSFPKADGMQKDSLGCLFLAVNPSSSRLTETLSYIADLIAYLNAQKDLWYFKDKNVESGSFAEQIYRVYQNGEIPFAVDSDVYLSNFWNVLSGTISIEDYTKDTERRLRMYLGE